MKWSRPALTSAFGNREKQIAKANGPGAGRLHQANKRRFFFRIPPEASALFFGSPELMRTLTQESLGSFPAYLRSHSLFATVSIRF